LRAAKRGRTAAASGDENEVRRSEQREPRWGARQRECAALALDLKTTAEADEFFGIMPQRSAPPLATIEPMPVPAKTAKRQLRVRHA